MNDMNKAIVTGRLTHDPELRYTANGNAVTDLRLAINRQWKTDAGDQREDTVFVDVTAWSRTAENCHKYLRKGKQVLVEAHLKMDTWEDKATGEKRSKLKLEAENVRFLDPPDGQRGDDAPPRRDSRGQWGDGSGGGERRPPARPNAPEPMPVPADDEEDIPFVNAYSLNCEPLA